MNLKLRLRAEIRRRNMKRLYAQFIRAGDLAFDIGANVGSRTRIFSELGARVIAVEPQKECVRRLYVQFHNDPRVTIIPNALGAESGQATMYISPDPHVSSLIPGYTQKLKQHPRMTESKIDCAETRSVPVTTLDALIAKFGVPVFTKIDVEGFETAVLRGLSHPIPACSFEFLPFYLESALGCIARMEEFGDAHYRYNFSIEETMQLVLKEWGSADEILRHLEKYRNCADILYGDVYARLNAK
jgi:FkbM family methyltransferase